MIVRRKVKVVSERQHSPHERIIQPVRPKEGRRSPGQPFCSYGVDVIAQPEAVLRYHNPLSYGTDVHANVVCHYNKQQDR